MARQLLVDADFTLFQACSAVEREEVFENEAGHAVHVLNSSREEAYETFLRMVTRYSADLYATETVLVFSGPNNFRKEVWDGYKANRAATRKPLCYWAVIDLVREAGEYPVISEDCLEGDDYLGILATRPSSADRIIVSEDKDMQTLPNVQLFRNWDGHMKPASLRTTTAESAETFWLYQTLMGDSTDGYKGCPGIGPKAAEKILEKPGDPWANVVAAYQEAHRKDKDPDHAKFLGRTPEELALLNAQLARIIRFTDWDSKSRRPILWTPDA
jgi:5'-3' exonuclease